MNAQALPGIPQLSLKDRVLMFFFGIKTDRECMGFNWAAGQLLRGEHPTVIRVMATTHVDEGDPWRVGALAAIAKALGETK